MENGMGFFFVVAGILFSTTEPIEHNSIAKLISAKWFWGMWSCIKRGPMNMLHGWRFVHQNARSKHYVCLGLCSSVSFSFFSGSFSFYFQYYKINIFGFYSVLFFRSLPFSMCECLLVCLSCLYVARICLYVYISYLAKSCCCLPMHICPWISMPFTHIIGIWWIWCERVLNSFAFASSYIVSFHFAAPFFIFILNKF